MACDLSLELCKLLKAAYESSSQRRKVPDRIRGLPGVKKWFPQSEHQIRRGWTEALDAVPGQWFWCEMSHGAAAKDTYIIEDREAFEAALVEAFPDAVAQTVIQE
jgi:hypothetical protein